LATFQNKGDNENSSCVEDEVEEGVAEDDGELSGRESS
jgi:hypothetical protein